MTDAEKIAALTPAERLDLAKQWFRTLWSAKGLRKFPREDVRIDRLNEVCTALAGGDPVAGAKLAREAIYS